MAEILVQSFEFMDWSDYPENGVVLAENEEWILIHNTVAYLLDGYKLLKKSFIVERKREEAEKVQEKVLQLRNYIPKLPQHFNFGNTLESLRWVEQTYGFFEFKDYEEEEIFLGTLYQVDEVEGSFKINFLNTQAQLEVDEESEFYFDEVRIISFESDYLDALRLLYHHQHKGKPAQLYKDRKDK